MSYSYLLALAVLLEAAGVGCERRLHGFAVCDAETPV